MSKFITEYFYAPLRRTERTVESGMWVFKETRTVEEYHFEVDLEKYSKYLADTYNNLDSNGYDVVNVIPLQMSHEKPCYQQLPKNGGTNYVGSATHNLTQGAVVVGRRRDVKSV